MNMAITVAIKVVVLICCCFIAGSSALQCLKCVNLEVKSGSSALKNMLDGKSDPKCGSPSIADNPNSETCSNFADECGLVESEVTTSVLLLGSATFKMQARGCMRPPETITAPTCYEGDSDVGGAVKGILNVILKLSFDSTVDGRVCYCTTDLCSAGGCGDGKVGIAGYCLEWYYWALSAVGGIVTMLLLTCCCCCCCACCRSKKTRGTVIQVAPQPQALVITTANGVGGIENPAYTQVPMIQK